MPTLRSAKLTLAVALAGVLLAAAPTNAAPLATGATQLKSTATGYVEPVRSRGGGAGAVIGGLAAGMILGGIIASQPHYYGPGYYYGPPAYYYGPPGPPDWDSYCFSRYRSYDPYSGTYMGYDGVRRPCR